jgi:hypothetical protein
MNRALLSACTAITLALPACTSPDAVEGDTCQLRHPIVLSHHWSAAPICADPLPSEQCDRRQPARYCADWRYDAELERDTCHAWRIPEDERWLPPRDTNDHDPDLQRSMDGHLRYYSRAIVERLEACGNEVYLSDKPPYASYEVRARSLRNTVLNALEASGSDRVHLFGMSQGVQDARYMTAVLPVDDADASRGWMRDRVASVVSVVGEDQGAESASLLLTLLPVGDEDGWSALPPSAGISQEDMAAVLWRDGAASDSPHVLLEGYDPHDSAEYDLDAGAMYATFLRSVADLSMEYMTGNPDAGMIGADGWAAVRAHLDMDETGWPEVVLEQDERDNGVEYLSYAAMAHRWDAADWGADLAFSLIRSLYGDNDGYVTVASQSFADKGYPNFHHVKTMAGSDQGRGYHHMYFSGRHDAIYGPADAHREPPPYGESSADFYEQVARDLAARGL